MSDQFAAPAVAALARALVVGIAAVLLLGAGDAWTQSAAPKAASGATKGSGPTTNSTVSGGDGGDPAPVRTPAFFEQGILVRSGEVIQPLGPNLMGDQVNEFSGGLAFNHTDVSLPGNNALPVEVGRHLSAGTRQAALNSGLFGDWDLEIPRLHTVAFADKPEWYGGDGAGSFNLNRCSQMVAPPHSSYQLGTWPAGRMVGMHPASWFSGYRLYAPRQGDQVLYRRAPPSGNGWVNPTQPSDGNSCPILTKQHWQIACLPTLELGAGEGFIALAPDGTRYRFDRLVKRAYLDLDVSTSTVSGRVARVEIWILPSLVTDRFGNWVRYNYLGGDGWRLDSITSSDGRAIRFTYTGSGNRVASVNDGTRTWNYSYDGSGALQTVTQPDNSRWTFSLRDLERDPFATEDWGCGTNPRARWDPNQHVGTITHPSGAVGTFALAMTIHGRTNVPGDDGSCDTGSYVDASGIRRGYMVSRYYAAYSLASKTLAGPGMPAMTWNYEYSQALGSFATCGANCVGSKKVTITDPKGTITRNTYGTGYSVNDGLLLSSEVLDGAVSLRMTSNTYRAPTAGPYPSFIGYEGGEVQASMEYIHTPIESRTIGQQGMNFVRQFSGFDQYARPSQVTRSNAAYSRVEQTYFHDRTDLWVLGQTASHWVGGRRASNTTFHPASALPTSFSKFELLQESYGFNSDGTLSTVADGAGNTTRFFDYFRGLPQRIQYADGASTTAVANNIGNIDSATNEVGGIWRYGYDAMGRLASKTPPGGFLPALLRFEQIPADEVGLAAGHWRQTITTGNAVTINYFDARWRKRMAVAYDASNVGTTSTVQRFDYDPFNRTTFASYAARSMASINSAVPGTTTVYDGLGRTVRVVADSELGPLTTQYAYLPSFQRQVTNPRGFSSTTAFQTFDEPAEGMPVELMLPEGTKISITRNVFGKPLSTSKGRADGSGLTVTRRYVYDYYQRLCKTFDPETAATLQGYDAAGNMVWRSTGLNLPGDGCETSIAESQLVRFQFDVRNRLRWTTFGDGSADVRRDYTPDGLPERVASGSSVWTYGYNALRQPDKQTATVGDSTYPFSWSFDGNGHVASVFYPGGASVSYAPNALGQPTQISGYASVVWFHSNGQLGGYTLNSGAVHSTSQNLRGLPQSWGDSGVFLDQYSYDANGNVTGIADQAGVGTSRTMGYDGLDRLLTTTSPLWGTASYVYDAVDNLRSSTMTSGKSVAVSIDANNRINGMTVNGTALAMLVDARGNLTQRGSQGFVFDLGNRLQAAPGLATYAYDGHGRRVSTVHADGSWSHQLFAGTGAAGQLLMKHHSTQGDTRYVYLGNKLIAEENTATGRRYVHTDALGSPVARSGGAQGLVRTHYEPYGVVAGGATPTGIGFTGHVNDADTGLVYMQQRYYDPIAGRFLSVDPIVTDANTGKAFNLYEYAQSNPYRYTDPDGRDPKCSVGMAGCTVTVFSGTPQSTGTPNHDTASQTVGQAAAKQGAAKVHYNQALSTVTGDSSMGTQRPDVSVVWKDGKVSTVEIVSDSQSRSSQVAKGDAIQAKLATIGRAGNANTLRQC